MRTASAVPFKSPNSARVGTSSCRQLHAPAVAVVNDVFVILHVDGLEVALQRSSIPEQFHIAVLVYDQRWPHLGRALL